MTMLMVRRLVSPAALVFLLASCDESTKPDPTLSDTLRFDYSGAMTGTFTASGDLPLDESGMATTIPASGAIAIERPGVLTLVAVRRTGSDAGDAIVLRLGGFAGVGTYSMYELCDPDYPDACRTGGFARQVTLAQLRAAMELGDVPTVSAFALGAGSVSITELTATRVRGTFSLKGVSVTSGPSMLLNIEKGQFELPVRTLP